MQAWIQQWPGRKRVENLPRITLDERANYYKAFTSPNPDWNAVAYAENGRRIGSVTYAVSPLLDKLYVFQVDVDLDQRRRGYGLAILYHLANVHNLPIVPVHVVGAARSFWAAAANLKAEGLTVQANMSGSEMDAESARWSHLAADQARLESRIQERLSAGEGWYDAIGRGLESASA